VDQDHDECNFGYVDGEDLLPLIEAEFLERGDGGGDSELL